MRCASSLADRALPVLRRPPPAGRRRRVPAGRGARATAPRAAPTPWPTTPSTSISVPTSVSSWRVSARHRRTSTASTGAGPARWRNAKRVVRQPGPEGFEFGEHLALGPGRVGHQGVHQRTDRGAHVTAVGRRGARAASAAGSRSGLLQRRRRQRDDLVVADPQQLVGGQRRHAVPLTGRRLPPRRVSRATVSPRKPGPRRRRRGPRGTPPLAKPPTSAANASTQGADRCTVFGGGSVTGPSSWQNGEGQHRRRASLVGVPPVCTAVTSRAAAGAAHRHDQQPAFLGKQRRPGRNPSWPPSDPSSTSTRCWVPSTPPRECVLGHSPSCRPAMTTTSHSPAECRVRS